MLAGGAGNDHDGVMTDIERDRSVIGAGDPDSADLRRRLETLPLDRKVRLLSGRDQWSTWAEPAIRLRALIVSDGPVGIRGTRWAEDRTSVNTPSTTAVAATFDPAIAERVGQIIGTEARRKGVDVVLAPTVNLQRTPYFGRHFEAFSEDPRLTALIGAAFVRGIQSEGRVATVKHFVGNEAETDRLRSDSRIDERTLREAYLAPFEEVVRTGGLGVMCAYNVINGTLSSETPLLRNILFDEWGFAGFVISDWGAVRSVEASAAAAVDLAMPGPRTPWTRGLADAVREGRVAEDAVDDKLLRVLRLAAQVGALDGVPPRVDPATRPVPPEPEDAGLRAELARLAASGTVLLRNVDSLLPLDAGTLTSLAVVGPAAAAPRINGGGSAGLIAPAPVSVLDALGAALPGVDLRHAEGARPTSLVRPLGLEHGRAPGGDGVLLVEFLDADGAVLGDEVRSRTDTMIYGMGYPDGVAEDDVASFRATTRITVDRDGTYTLGAAGVGPMRIEVDGATVLDTVLEAVSADPVEGLSRPPQATVELDLIAGRPVDVVLHHVAVEHMVASLRVGFDVSAPDDDALVADAVAAARGADAAVVVIGTGPEDEAEGFDRETLALSGRQDHLVRAVAAVNPRTVVVVNAGSPVLLPWHDEVGAIVVPWFGGQEMGPSIAAVLTGELEPGGRLPVTWPTHEGEPIVSPRPTEGAVVYAEGLDIGHRAYLRTGIHPAYAFGHGLGYTTWTVDSALASVSGPDVTLEATVRNTGSRAGRHVVQVYCSRPGSAVSRPVLWFVAAGVVDAAAGTPSTVTIDIPRRMFEHWDVETHAWALEPGAFTLHVGAASDDCPLTVPVDVG